MLVTGRGNIDSIIFEKGVKLHCFEPSGRKIWTVVGRENEHWLDPDLGYCSCEDYYYNALNRDEECYHLKAARASRQQSKIDIIKFSDSEFESFVAALLTDMI